MVLSRNPNVLFLAYHFPPARHVASVRTWNIAKYLARSGWDVTVVTPHPSVWREIENLPATETSLRREGIRRLCTEHLWRWLAPDRLKCSNQGVRWLLGGVGRRLSRHLGIDKTVGWVSAAERLSGGLAADSVDVILASGPPFSAFPLAQRLSDKLGRPYVLDYRDLWSRNLHDPAPSFVIRKEATVLARSSRVITVSPSWAAVMDRQFGIGPKVHVISNGYDGEELESVKPHDFGHFAIVYTGVFYPPKRVISPLMAALRRLVGAVNAEWWFHYYGNSERHVWAEAQRHAVTERVVVHGKVPRSEALSAVKGAGVAAVITSVGESATARDDGMVTAKIFEAVGLGTPTLVIAPSSSDVIAVAETTGLARTFVASDVAGIAGFLRGLMNGDCLRPGSPATYSWKNLIEAFNRVLLDVTTSR